jgi:hypothetical protein
MIGAAGSTNGASAMAAAPTNASARAARPSITRRVVLLRLDTAPANATNHTSTDRSTCATSTVRKKSPAGSRRPTPGVRARARNTASRPDAASAPVPSASQPVASEARTSRGTSSA